MGRTELHNLLGTAATGAVFAFWLMRLTDGTTVVAQPMAAVFGTVVAVSVLMAVSHGLIAGVTALLPGLGGVSMDERDHLIEARAERAGGLVVAGLLITLALHVTGEAVWPAPWLPQGIVPYATPQGFVFLMVSVVFVGELATGLIKAVLYRWRG
jgi:hypothetical protein